MNRCLLLVVLAWSAIALLMLAACGSSKPTATATPLQTATPTPTLSPAPASIARSFLEAVASGDYTSAEAMEDSVMSAAAPAATLEQLRQGLVTMYGAFQSMGEVTTASQPPYINVTIPVTFANATVALIVTVSAESQVAGLHIGTVTPSVTPTPADYVNPDSFTESDITVGSAPWALPGTLTMPKGTGPFPAVVLIAGSGPQDRDETIGPNKPLRDLAWGLASQGIAVLRYDKRTLVYGS
jgi:hypothetical protein